MNRQFVQQILLFFLAIILTSVQAFAQPANDDCSNATPLSMGNGSCGSPTIGTNVGATDSGVNHPLSCGWYQGGDVWFSFVAPANGEVIIETSDINSQFIDTDIAIYGSCGGPQLYCDTDSGVASYSKLNLTGLTPGATYYVAIWEYLNDAAGTFNVCAWTTGSAPANDECANAIQLGVNADLNCGNTTAGTVTSATASTQTETCFNGGFDNDVWYQFVATATTHQITFNNITNGVVDMTYQLITGACSGTAFTELYCVDIPDVGWTATSLTIGQTYYLRVATFNPNPGQTTTFDVCIGTIPTNPPSNDECTNAIPITMTSGSCILPLTVNNGAATTSQTVHTCANYQGGDTWYSFVAPASGEVTVQTNDNGDNAFADTGLAVYSSCPPGPASSLDCDDDSFLFFAESELTGLSPGATYYVAVWEGFNDAIITFTICAFDPATTSACPPDFAFGANGGLTGTILNVQDYESDGRIESTQILMATSRVDYDSQTYVEMRPGFEVKVGAVFQAFIDGCNGGSGGVN